MSQFRQSGVNSHQIDVLVLGAGIAGLSTAWHLRESGLSVKVLEASRYLFGHAKSHLEFGVVWDEGPHVSFTKNAHVRDFISQGESEIREFSPVVSSYFKGTWLDHPVQHHIEGLPQDLRARVEADLHQISNMGVREKSEQTYKEWLLTNFGRTLSESFFFPYTEKYWRADAQELSVDWVSDRIAAPISNLKLRNEKTPEHYIGTIRYPKYGGFQQVYGSLTQGVDISLSKELVGIDLGLRQAIDITGDIWDFSTLVNTAPLPIFCSLLPKEQRPETTGLEWTAIWLSNCSPRKKPLRSETWGYVYDPEVSFARFWQPHELLSQENDMAFGIQTETYVRRAIVANGDLPKRSAREVQDALGSLKSSLSRDLVEIGLVDKNCEISIAQHYLEWGNVLFTKDTKSRLDDIWNSLRVWGLKREDEDLSPTSTWTSQGLPAAGVPDVGTTIMAGRYAQWKYFWSDDCFLRGRAVAEAIQRKHQ